MTTTQDTQLDKTAAYWYACGYNDHRDQLTQDYIDPVEFMAYWLDICQGGSRPSMQDAFKAFAAQPACRCKNADACPECAS